MRAMKASRAIFRAFVQAAAEWHKKLANKQQDFESVEKELIHHRGTEAQSVRRSSSHGFW